MKDYVVVQNIYTEAVWLRKIGEGPWERVDLSVFGGIVPLVFTPRVTWAMEERWIEYNSSYEEEATQAT